MAVLLALSLATTDLSSVQPATQQRHHDVDIVLTRETRLCPSESRTSSYGRLSIMLGCCMEIEPLFDVPATAFNPPPKVTSSIVRLRPLPDDTHDISDRHKLSSIVAEAFSQRRKTLRNALKASATEEDLIAAGMDPQSRPERATIANYVALANLIACRLR